VIKLEEATGTAVNAAYEASATSAPIVIVISSPGEYSALSNVNVAAAVVVAAFTVTVYVAGVTVDPVAESAIVITEVPAATPTIVTTEPEAVAVATVVVPEVTVRVGTVAVIPAESFAVTLSVVLPLGAIQVAALVASAADKVAAEPANETVLVARTVVPDEIVIVPTPAVPSEYTKTVPVFAVPSETVPRTAFARLSVVAAIKPAPVIEAESAVAREESAVAELRAITAMLAATVEVIARGATTATASVVVVGVTAPADIRTEEAAAETAAGASAVTVQVAEPPTW
jgi:hypothetical protein